MYVLFDIGGTKMRLALSEDGLTIGEPRMIDTPVAYSDGIDAFARIAEELLGGRRPDGIVGGIAGPFSERRSALLGSPNLHDWIDKPLGADIGARLGAPVHIENDSALVGLGEAVFGAGRGFDIVAYVTVSTGVGGARIVNGAIDEKSIGFEPGHQIIDMEHTLQDLVSGKAVEAETGRPPKEVSDPEYWNEMARRLAYGLNNTVVHWSPDALVLGGSMITGDPAIPFDRIGEQLAGLLRIVPVPAVRKAELGNFGGLWGALAYARQHHL